MQSEFENARGRWTTYPPPALSLTGAALSLKRLGSGGTAGIQSLKETRSFNGV